MQPSNAPSLQWGGQQIRLYVGWCIRVKKELCSAPLVYQLTFTTAAAVQSQINIIFPQQFPTIRNIPFFVGCPWNLYVLDATTVNKVMDDVYPTAKQEEEVHCKNVTQFRCICNGHGALVWWWLNNRHRIIAFYCPAKSHYYPPSSSTVPGKKTLQLARTDIHAKQGKV